MPEKIMPEEVIRKIVKPAVEVFKESKEKSKKNEGFLSVGMFTGPFFKEIKRDNNELAKKLREKKLYDRKGKLTPRYHEAILTQSPKFKEELKLLEEAGQKFYFDDIIGKREFWKLKDEGLLKEDAEGPGFGPHILNENGLAIYRRIIEKLLKE